MEEKPANWSEKRFSPRVSASSKLSFKTHEISGNDGREAHKRVEGHADLINISLDGMGIKTPVPLEESYLLEFKKSYHTSQVALVRWVKKIDDQYYAGLLYVSD